MTLKKPFRTPEQVAQDHITAVLAGDPKQMADDYSNHAVLHRGEDIHNGIEEIRKYFQTVPERLGDSRIIFDKLTVEGSKATFYWRIIDEVTIASGTDYLTIENGEIIHQVVQLNSSDF